MKLKFRDKILNPFSILFILLFWLATFFVFYQKELKQYFAPYKNIGYKAIIPKDLLIEDEWKVIYLDEIKIGFSHTYLRLASQEVSSGYMLENTTIMNLPIGIVDAKINFHSVVNLSPEKNLKDFKISLKSNMYSTQILGEVISPGELKITQKTNNQETIHLLEVPQDLVISSFIEPISRFKNISPGEDFSFNIFNPVFMKHEKVKVHVKDTKKASEGVFFVLSCQYQNFEYILWVNEEGQIIKEISPIGIKIVRVTQPVAMQGLSEIYKNISSIRDYFSIPVKIDYHDTSKLDMLKVKLKNINPFILNLETANQFVVDKRSDSVTIQIQKDNTNKTSSADNIDLERYLKATAYIQKDDLSIINLSRRIISGIKQENDIDKVKAIMKWIKLNIRKLPTFSIPSAVEILKTKVGDCNEITYLFTALARTVNIPARIITGLVCIDNRFQYHMWPEVYINNNWVSIDPTLDQFPSDATHIGLLQGNYTHQLNLVNVISKIDIEILEYRGE